MSRGYGSDKKNRKQKGAKNHRVRPGCHKLMTMATYNGKSVSSKNLSGELEEKLRRINWDIPGLCEIRRKVEEKIS